MLLSTWAHSLHIIDTQETAHEFGLKLQSKAQVGEDLRINAEISPYKDSDFSDGIRHWLLLSYALR